MEERLQKIMARAGIGSRRDCEVLIQAGRVRVNGIVAHIGAKADPAHDQISVDGNPLQKAEAFVYVALHKPRGVLSTVDAPDTRKTVRDLVPLPGTLYPVGRLDVDSEGLILMTNDGDLANRLTHPRYGHEKEYRVLVARQPDLPQLEAWRHGIILEDGYRTAPASVIVEEKFGRGAWLRVVIKEGRKRQIREMGSRTGLPVVRIIRVRIGSLLLGSLKPGEWRSLNQREVVELKSPEASAARRRVAQRQWAGNYPNADANIHPHAQRTPAIRSNRRSTSEKQPPGEPAGATKPRRTPAPGRASQPNSQPSASRPPSNKRTPRRSSR
jgi:23S rRNA pseudouridine2605 synthase